MNFASGSQPLPSDINQLIKSIPNLVVNIPGFGDVDVSKVIYFYFYLIYNKVFSFHLVSFKKF